MLCTSASGDAAAREACAQNLVAWSPRRAAEACARASDLIARAKVDSKVSTTPLPSEVAAHARRAFSAREWPLFPEYRLAPEGEGASDAAPAPCWTYSCCGRIATHGDTDTCPLLRESALSPALAHACWRSREGRPRAVGGQVVDDEHARCPRTLVVGGGVVASSASSAVVRRRLLVSSGGRRAARVAEMKRPCAAPHPGLARRPRSLPRVAAGGRRYRGCVTSIALRSPRARPR